MRISGGTMFGYCATGRLNIVTSPTTTCKMARTMATIGRLMKKRYITMWPASFLRHGRRIICGFRVIGLRIDHGSLLDLLGALRHDPVIRLKPFVNQPVVAHLLAHLHCFEMDRVRRVNNG